MLEAGISDHHNLIITALKSQLVKGNAKTKLYRGYMNLIQITLKQSHTIY